ncbi:MAG: ATP phosphoribosyltransferase regulatory subunit [Desulfuromonadales bacterium]|nr:ATP phosphoribosyltransferase regulatory subunit [Desulfuromonadales bacterium]NIR33517.1 ATP phosphoribosyltransferase regulatory subunit [Desulfuromonadales bacterium]NIS39691.1 ATP phosphoribosyltransferase regulatory subunit [Desulfuromonadales bacterium]
MDANDKTSEIALPTGVKDFLPAKAAKIDHLSRTLYGTFRRWGFQRIVPPSLEYLSVLERGIGATLRDRVLRFDDRLSGRMVAFSPDITAQVARIAATRMREHPLPLRLCYSGRVLRHTEQQAGKDREIFQDGVELIGLDSPEADAEMIAMVVESLTALGAGEFTVDIGQVEFFRGVMASLPLTDDLARRVEAAIAHKDSSGLKALLADIDIDEQARAEVLALPRLFGGPEVIEKAAAVVRNDRSRRALENLEKVFEILKVYGVEKHVTIDLGELRGLDYHTGIIFQGFLPGLGRAVCSGGRYDNLTARYGFPAPATGFTFNLLNLLFALDRELDQQVSTGSDVLILQGGTDKEPAQRAAQALRRRGYSAARDIIRRELEQTVEYARKTHFTYLMIIGDEGKDARLVRLDDRSERQIAFADLLADDFTLDPT